MGHLTAGHDPGVSAALSLSDIAYAGVFKTIDSRLAAWQQRDATPLLGYGRFVTPKLALELDAGPSYARGDYASFVLVPGLVWTFSPNAYLAARFIVTVDPERRLTLFPGIGLSRTFKDRITPILELNLSSTRQDGKPDFGIALTAGVLIAF